MKRCVYQVEGFDCPACAAEAEEGLSKDAAFSSVRIDAVTNRLYVSLVEEMEMEEIERRLNAVSDDPVTLSEVSSKKTVSMWNAETKVLLLRILYCIAVFFVCAFSLREAYWVRFGLYLSAYVLIGYDVFFAVIKNIVRRKNPVDEHLLMSLASAGAFLLACLQYSFEGSAASFENSFFLLEGHMEAIFVMGLYQVGEVIEGLAKNHARKQIEAAFALQKGESRLVRGEETILVDPACLREGDTVMVRRGEELYVDGTVLQGEAYCNTSALNGEFESIKVEKGSLVYGGYVIEEGEILVRSSSDYASSARGKIESMLQEVGSEKSQAERLITTFARAYTPMVFLTSLLYILIAGLVSKNWMTSVFTGLEIMVVSCPCAIVISVPLAFLASLGRGSKEGIMMKNVGVLDALKKITRFVSDKTGTLTEGRFSLTKEIDVKGRTKLREAACIAEAYSLHPLGKAVREAFGKAYRPDSYEEIDGKGVKAVYDGATYFAGSLAFLQEVGMKIQEDRVEGKAIYIGSSKDGYLGVLCFEDRIRDGAYALSEELGKREIKRTVLSGDEKDHVSAFCEKLHFEEGHAELSPSEKLDYLKDYLEAGESVLYLGDGSNDAPCLGLASVGVAIGEARTALAVNGADAVILNNKPESILLMLDIARKARRTAWFNIAAALAIKAAILVLTIALNGKMPMEVAVIADSGTMVLLTLNSLRLLRAKH